VLKELCTAAVIVIVHSCLLAVPQHVQDAAKQHTTRKLQNFSQLFLRNLSAFTLYYYEMSLKFH